MVPCVAGAQETRTAILERQRAEKRASLQPYEPGKLEKWMLWYEDADLKSRISPHNGFFVRYGFTNRPVGAGIGFGGGWRHDLLGDHARVELEGGVSFRNYRVLRADFSLPYLVNERVELGVRALHNHNPQEDFFGPGAASVVDDRVSFLADYMDVQGRALVRPRRWLEAGARVGRVGTSLDRGTDSRYPSIEERFGDLAAPGLIDEPDFTYGEVMAAVDYRDQRDNARDGGYYALFWRRYAESDVDRFNFRLVDARIQQFFPVFDKKRVFALQARAVAATPDEGHRVPFYFQPTLGGSTTLRSFTDYRFRDNAVLYFNAEYRWEAFSGMDMALFTDLGTVAPRFGDIALGDLKKAYGIGFRFNTYKAVFMRIDIATGGGEGVRTFFKFSKAF